MLPRIRVLANAQALAREAAELFIASAEQSIIATGRFAVALSGGSTPKRLYELLASEPYAGRVDWARVHALFSDERCVPADHPESNFGMACRALLDHVPVPYEQIHRMPGELNPEAAADAYEELLQKHFAKGLDLVLLGMGEDGHTASLFPGTAALEVTNRACVANFVPALNAPRLTLTASYINRAFGVAVLVEGPKKAAPVDQVLAGMESLPRFPIQLIAPQSGRFHWLMDVAAARMDSDADET